MSNHKASKQILYIWWIEAFLAAFFLCALTSIIFDLFSPFWYVIMAIILVLFCFTFSFYLPKKYKKYSFSVFSDYILIHSGVFFTKTKHMPMENIQFVVKVTGIMDHFFGLRSITIRAAGGAARLYGMTAEEADEMMDQLVRQIEKGEDE